MCNNYDNVCIQIYSIVVVGPIFRRLKKLKVGLYSSGNIMVCKILQERYKILQRKLAEWKRIAKVWHLSSNTR